MARTTRSSTPGGADGGLGSGPTLTATSLGAPYDIAIALAGESPSPARVRVRRVRRGRGLGRHAASGHRTPASFAHCRLVANVAPSP
jgi:hypothetical protein